MSICVYYWLNPIFNLRHKTLLLYSVLNEAIISHAIAEALRAKETIIIVTVDALFQIHLQIWQKSKLGSLIKVNPIVILDYKVFNIGKSTKKISDTLLWWTQAPNQSKRKKRVLEYLSVIYVHILIWIIINTSTPSGLELLKDHIVSLSPGGPQCSNPYYFRVTWLLFQSRPICSKPKKCCLNYFINLY